MKVIKRNGTIENFNSKKIENVIKLAFSKNGIENEKIISEISNHVIGILKQNETDCISVEEVQDIIQRELMKSNFFNIASKFIEYRYQHKKEREIKNRLYSSIASICKVTDRENANVGNGPSSKMLQIAENSAKDFYDTFLELPNFLNAKKNNKVYDHDSSWGPIGTTTCLFIPLGKILKNGFNTGHGFTRSPKRIKTAAQLACIALQANQNDQHGGQAFSNFEESLSLFVKREYEWQVMSGINTLMSLGFIHSDKFSPEDLKLENDLDFDDLDELCDISYSEELLKAEKDKYLKSNYKDIFDTLTDSLKEKIEKLAWENTEKETFQAMEATIHNLNCMHSRAGAQIPFSSINVGTDTTREGRLITKQLLLAYEKGLGKGEQPLFPNICFKVKSGVNYEPNSPNFDLLLIALRVSSKRLFPTFNFQDCTLNKKFVKDNPTMGCRTGLGFDRHSKEQTFEGRGNLSFTTVNLSSIALDNKINIHQYKTFKTDFKNLTSKYSIQIPNIYLENDLIKMFFIDLNKYLDITIEQLLERFKYQSTFKKCDFPFLMSGMWLNSENLKDNDTVGEVLKHGTLGIGFIALAETLKTLVGEHHGENPDSNRLGLSIVKFLHDKANSAGDKYNLNFAVIATPAEGLSGKSLNGDRNIYGVIDGVTNKEWYTNSYHIPVEFDIDIFEKIKIEGEYSKYCAGGSITYVELNESPLGNIDAYYKILQAMYNSDVAYGAINFPCDRCSDCNHFGVINHDCPVCGSSNISRIRRITGYLAEENNFNFAKKKEKDNRVVHLNISQK